MEVRVYSDVGEVMQSARSIIFTPLSKREMPESAKSNATTKLHQETTDPILLYGEMMRDAKTILGLLKNLPLDGAASYRGTLRAVLSSAGHLKERAQTLIGD